MNFELKKINWIPGKEATQLQVMTLKVREAKAADVESNYTTISNALMILPDGTVFNPPAISDLKSGENYVFRLINNDPAGGKLDMTVNVPTEFKTADIPQKYYHNSELIYNKPAGGFRDAMLPPKIGAYYSLEYAMRDWFGNFANCSSTGSTVKVLDHIGMKVGKKGDGIVVPITLADITSNTGNKYYSIGVHFYVAAADLPATGEWPLISVMAAGENGIYVYVDCATRKIHWRQKSASASEEMISNGTINPDSWNKILVFRAADPAQSKMWLNYVDAATGQFSNASAFVDNNLHNLEIGNKTVDNSTVMSAVGGVFKYVYFTDIIMDGNIAGKYQDPPYPIGILEDITDPANKYQILRKNMIVLNNDRIVCTVPPDAPVGRRKFYIQNSSGVTAPIDIEVLPDAKALAPIVADFENNPTEAGRTVVNAFYPMAKAWGGANGGVAPENIYIQDNLLVFEAHGDSYDGSLQGYNRDGSPKKHDIPNDPLFGNPWKRRVGAVMSTKEYCGYGSFRITAKLPEKIGVAPAFWTFHYGEVYPQDPRYEQLLAQGLRRQGSYEDGYYIVENNEIDIELPSHNAMYVFATVAEMLTPNYNIVWNGELVAVANDPDTSKNGTWKLINAAKPNLAESWVKVNDEIQRLYQPTKFNMKCNNWKGELGGGNGFTFGTDPFQDEYLAMLTSLDRNVWDGRFHEFRFDWYADRVEFFVDGARVQVNSHFVPDVPGRWTVGLWFPSKPDRNEPWKVDPLGAWAGPVADWRYQKMLVSRMSFEPFTDTVAGGANRLVGETYPFAGFKQFV